MGLIGIEIHTVATGSREDSGEKDREAWRWRWVGEVTPNTRWHSRVAGFQTLPFASPPVPVRWEHKAVMGAQDSDGSTWR